MNLRLQKGEVRLRLERKEGEALGRGESLAQEITFPSGEALRFWVDPLAGDEPPRVALDGGLLTVSVSAPAVRELLAQPPARDLGLRAELDTPAGPLKVVVEIDLFGEGKGPKRRPS